MLRTLVILIGQVRAAELTWPSFEQMVLRHLGADLALAVASGPPTEYHQHAKYYWPWEEPEDLAELWDGICREMGVPSRWRELMVVKGWWAGGMREFPNTYPSRSAWLYFARWWLLRNAAAVADGYDQFVITRSDFRYLSHHPRGLDTRYLWLPDTDGYGGVTDMHAVMSWDLLKKVVSAIEPIWRESKRLRDELITIKNPDHEWNPEQVLFHLLQRAGVDNFIRYFPCTFFLVREKNGPTNWSVGEWREEQNCMVKYPEEYNHAVRTAKELGQ